MKKNAVKLYFSIDGEWLSTFARTRVLEGAWESALRVSRGYARRKRREQPDG